MDLVRNILLAMEAEPSGNFNGRLCFEGYPLPPLVKRHRIIAMVVNY
jgi:hypothetical protein